MKTRYIRRLKPVLESMREFAKASVNNIFIAAGILVLPLAFMISNFLVVDQLPLDLPIIGFSNNSTSQEGNRLSEVINALDIPDDTEYKAGVSEYLFQINEQVREADFRSAVKRGEIDFAVIIPPDFGSDNQNGRVQGGLIIIGDRNTNPSVRVMESVIDETLKEYNDEQNEKAIGRAPIDIYSYNADAVISNKPIYQPNLNTYALLVAVPSLIFILRAIRRKRNNNTPVVAVNEGLPDIIFLAILLSLLQIILWLTTLVLYKTLAINILDVLMKVFVVSIFSWFIGLYIGSPAIKKGLSRLPRIRR